MAAWNPWLGRILGEHQPVSGREQRRLSRRRATGRCRSGQQVHGIGAGQRHAARRNLRRELRVEHRERPGAAQADDLVPGLLQDAADEGIEKPHELVEARGVRRVVLAVAARQRALKPGQRRWSAQRHLAQLNREQLLGFRQRAKAVGYRQAEFGCLAKLGAQRVVALAADVRRARGTQLGEHVGDLLSFLPGSRGVAGRERGQPSGLEPAAEHIGERLQPRHNDFREILELFDGGRDRSGGGWRRGRCGQERAQLVELGAHGDCPGGLIRRGGQVARGRRTDPEARR